MSLPFRFRHTGHFHSIFLIGMFICLLSACTLNSTTTYIKAPPPDDATVPIYSNPTCLNIAKIREELNNFSNEELRYLRSVFSRDPAKREKFVGLFEEIAKNQKLACPSTYDNLWSTLRDEVIRQNNGLIDTKLGRGDYEQILLSAIGNTQKENEISISYKEPASLSLSVRPWPPDADSSAFANLKERAQASLIEYAKAYVKIPGKKDGKEVPVASAESLLDALSKTEEPRFPEKRRLELTVSTIINSANIDDRFDYISAYLTVPPLPGAINGRISLERLFLTTFQSMYMSHLEGTQESFVDRDISRALDSIRVRIEIIDPLNTVAASISLGKLTSNASFSPELSIETGSPATKVAAKGGGVSATREDTLAKEIDKRSFWINPQRSLLRITQRGMQEATISGSFASAITLRIPKTNLYVMGFKYKDDGETITAVVLNNIEQPLYSTVDAIGTVLGTVRVAIPSWYPYRKELNGLAFTVVAEKPIPLRLWNHDRPLLFLSYKDMNPTANNVGTVHLGFHRKEPFVKQAALLKDSNSWSTFLNALMSNKQLILVERGEGNSKWYAIVPCDSLKDKNASIAAPGEVMLGVEDATNGHIRPFNSTEEISVMGGCQSTHQKK
jgi:hypothetical protein